MSYRWLLFAVVIAFAKPCLGRAQTPVSVRGFGAISGKVIDAQNRPVARANVYADILGKPAGRRHSTVSGPDGKFQLDSLQSGEYVVHASKDQEGYPDNFFAFFASGREAAVQVVVKEHAITRNVQVRLAGVGARLMGRVISAATGHPILNANIILRRQNDPKIYVSFVPTESDGGFSTRLPDVVVHRRSVG